MYGSVQKELPEERASQEEHSKENEGAAMEEKRGEAPLGCNYKSLNPVRRWPPEHEREEEEGEEEEGRDVQEQREERAEHKGRESLSERKQRKKGGGASKDSGIKGNC